MRCRALRGLWRVGLLLLAMIGVAGVIALNDLSGVVGSDVPEIACLPVESVRVAVFYDNKNVLLFTPETGMPRLFESRITNLDQALLRFFGGRLIRRDGCSVKDIWTGCEFTFHSAWNRCGGLSDLTYFKGRSDQFLFWIKDFAVIETAEVISKINLRDRCWSRAVIPNRKWNDRNISALSYNFWPRLIELSIKPSSWNGGSGYSKLTSHQFGLLFVCSKLLTSNIEQPKSGQEGNGGRNGLYPVRDLRPITFLWVVTFGSMGLMIVGVPLALAGGSRRDVSKWFWGEVAGYVLLVTGAIGLVLAARADILGHW